jgi:hypothetical protein
VGWLNRLFGGSAKKPAAKAQAPSRQLPSTVVAKEFGEVNVRTSGGLTEVTFTILMEPEGSEAEGWQTGVALDASASMMHSYGNALTTGPAGAPPQHLIQEYARKGWIQVKTRTVPKTSFGRRWRRRTRSAAGTWSPRPTSFSPSPAR